MNNETCVVTIADIYGAEWWERNKAELDREWEWEFALAGAVKVAHVATPDIQEFSWYMPDGRTAPRIILHRRKPKPPTLREVYGTDEVTIPQGLEWTGEWREPKTGDRFQSGGGRTCAQFVHRCEKDTWFDYRLILRERPKKVWFRAEEKPRYAKAGDWYAYNGEWTMAKQDVHMHKVFCATRHEEINQTVQVVTQEDVDKCKS